MPAQDGAALVGLANGRLCTQHRAALVRQNDRLVEGRLSVEDRAALDSLSHRLPVENRTTLSPVGDGILSGQHRAALRSLGHHGVSSLHGTNRHSRQMPVGRGRLLAQNGAVLIG